MVSVLMLMIISLQVNAGISSQVDRTTLQQGETLLLILDITDNDSNAIDLEPLEQNFEILGRNHRSSTSIINGDIKRSSKLLITLSPKNTGTLEIPTLTLGGDKSEPIKIEVTPVKMASAVDGGVELLSTLSDKTPLVQQPLIYQVNIVLGQRIFNAEFVEPKVRKGKALIQPLGEQRQYRQQLQGRNIMVVEQSWVITPQQSGPLEIESAKLSASIPSAQARSVNSRALQRIFLRADDYVLDVQPIPAAFSGNNWITANALKLEDELSSDEWKVGEPVTRTIILTAEGTSQDQFSELKLPEVAGLKQYSDKPKFDQSFGDKAIELEMTLEVTVIPSKEGTVTLPEIRLLWWNTEINQEEVAVIEAKTYNVAPGEFSAIQQSAVADSVMAPQAQLIQPQAVTQNPLQSGNEVVQVQAEPTLWGKASWLIITVVLLLGAGLGSVVTLFFARKKQTAATHQEIPPQVKPFSLSGLKKACQQNDAKAAREELAAWAQFAFPESKQLNSVLDKVSPELSEAITELNRCCFAEGSKDWDGGELYTLVAGFKAEHQAGKDERLVGLVPG
jgi:hypothetical protein